MFGWLRRWKPRTPAVGQVEVQPEAEFVVTVDDDSIHCRHPDGKDDHLPWVDLRAVFIETNDSGPTGADVWWVLVDREGKLACTVPQGATGEKALVDRLFKLPGFDFKASIKAMASTENNVFLCWRRLPTVDDGG